MIIYTGHLTTDTEGLKHCSLKTQAGHLSYFCFTILSGVAFAFVFGSAVWEERKQHHIILVFLNSVTEKSKTFHTVRKVNQSVKDSPSHSQNLVVI